MTDIKKFGCLCMIFASGFVSAMQLTSIVYGMPVHYEGSLLKLAAALFFFLLWSYFVIYDFPKDKP